MRKSSKKPSESPPSGTMPSVSEIGHAVDSILNETPGAALLPIAPGPQGGTEASFLGRPRQHYVSKNGRTLLTHSGQLKLALARLPERKGIDVRKLIDFAQSTVERELIRIIGQHKPYMLA